MRLTEFADPNTYKLLATSTDAISEITRWRDRSTSAIAAMG
jgi:hypothetical protein